MVLPYMSEECDVENTETIFKQRYPDEIIKKRIRWTVVRLNK